jgi:hypothetical protein
MISRRSTQTLARLYGTEFSKTFQSGSRLAATQRLYDFLFSHEYEPYLMNVANAIRPGGGPRAVEEFVMRLHTGETIAQSTPQWDWKRRAKLGNRLLVGLAEDILRYMQTVDRSYMYSALKHKDELRDQLCRNLELDGYEFRNARLVFTETAVLDTEEEEGLLQRLMTDLKLPDQQTPGHHLAKTAEHYTAGNWDDCISNARKVLESVLGQVAQIHSVKIRGTALDPQKLHRPVEIREYLHREGLLEEKEKKAVAEVYGLLSNTGGHPYIAEKDQARLMRHLALTFTQFAILRLQGALQSAGVPA